MVRIYLNSSVAWIWFCCLREKWLRIFQIWGLLVWIILSTKSSPRCCMIRWWRLYPGSSLWTSQILCITENVLLVQKIIKDINMRNQNTNMVVKLDMTKNYDRVSWIFLTKLLRMFYFSKIIIDTVWKLVSNSWYSVLICGQSYDFFQSIKDLKLGETISLLYLSL